MGRDDHAPPSRGKRPPPTTLKYDPAAASYDAYAAPYTDEAATGGSKRKRVKKERDDEWTDDRAHMTMPTILHRGGGVSTLMSTPPPPPPPPADIPAAPAPEYAVPYTHQTVFNGAPAEIVSFAETERRRSSATASSSNASLNHLVHTDESASTVATPKPTSASNGGLPWGNRRGGNGTMSVFDLFFPDQHRGRDQGSKSSSGRESKRRKRNNNGDSSSSRSSRRSAVVSSENYDVDMLRFTVDAFKLIPQGLVDRIDSRLRSDLVVSLISSHVDNWIKRIAFDDHNTLQEITSLLNAYYPCTYPTILDEVLVAFVFKRPELMEGMLKAMIERLQKTGESASPTKYPVVESFARKCGAGRVSASSKRERSRHDLACLTVLRLLLERNTEKCVLSPWIASCAADCSDEVLNIFWENLLQFHSPNVKQASLSWNIQEPLDQIFEVLREEKVLVRRGGIDNCRLSMTLIQKLTQDHTYKELRQVQFACEAFEAFFGSPVNPVTSRSLIRDWIEHEVRRGSDRSDAVHTVARVLVHNCSRLSVKKTNWFTKHVLGVLLSPDEPTREVVFPSVLNDILLSNSSLLFGGADKKDFDELDASNAGSSMQQYSSIVGMPSSNEKHTVDDVFVQIAELVGAVSRLPKHIMTEFFRHWSEAWCAPHVFVPWSYVLGLARFCVEKQSEHLTMLSKDLVVNHLGWVFKHENVVSLLPRLGVIVKVAIFGRNQKVASALMASLVESINTLPLESMVRSRASALVGSILIDQLSARQGPIQESRLQHLRAIYDLISRDDATGQFVRNCVLARRRLDAVIISSLDSDAQEAEQVLRVARSAIRLGSSAARSEFFLSSATIESIIVHGYSARNDSIRQEAIGILDASASSSRSRDLVLWSVIRYCTKVCCGCGQLNHTDREPDSTLVASTHFADLTRNILVRVPIDVLVHVGEFIRQNLEGSKGHWNTYVVQVLDRTIQLGWSKIRFVPRIVHLVLTPFDGHFASDESERVTHLRLLRSFCNALLSGFANRQGQKQHEACVSFARLVVSEQLQLKLRRIETRSSCSTAVSLAQSVLKLRGSIRVKLERYLAGAAVQKLLL